MKKQTHYTLAFVVPSETWDFCVFNPEFLWKKGVTHSNFVVPVFQGGDLCDIDGKADSFHFRFSGSKRKGLICVIQMENDPITHFALWF